MRVISKPYAPDPQKYIGKYVRATTYADHIWYVYDAYSLHDGVVRLCLESLDGKTRWHSDNEHATLTRYQGPGVEAVLNPKSRVVEWEDE